MRYLLTFVLITLSLKAGMFSFYEHERNFQTQKTTKNIQKDFRQNVRHANAIIKRGDYNRLIEYQDGIASIISRIDTLNISKEEKKVLKQDLNNYVNIVQTLYKNLQYGAPHFNQHYKNSMSEVSKFNKGLISIGYSPLLDNWHKLTQIKRRFIKKPSKSLERRFNQEWTSVMILITELYLDDDMEEPLLAYMKKYKSNFHEVQSSYAHASYAKIQSLKPLSYKIKSQLELL